MNNQRLTGDFITDHPLATMGIFLGAASLLSSVSDVSIKQKYEIQQQENRKKALRAQYMRDNPYRIMDYLSPEDLKYFFCKFAYNCVPEKIEKYTKKELINLWNNKYGVDMWGFKTFNCYKISDNEEEQTKSLNDMAERFQKSGMMQRIKDECWQIYTEHVEEKLILSGAF